MEVRPHGSRVRYDVACGSAPVTLGPLANETPMRELVFRGWTLRYDAEATAAAYAAARPVGSEACGCLYCRNFIAARELAYPAELKSFAETVGVSPLTESEIWEHGVTVSLRRRDRP